MWHVNVVLITKKHKDVKKKMEIFVNHVLLTRNTFEETCEKNGNLKFQEISVTIASTRKFISDQNINKYK